ncbi:dihydroorotase [Chondrinema litorale]|uniref:dihydroorotase n=1 Tax=Chondrinema litorale TaxID=2994555 RepID=UPI002542EB5E|nr:dihydroorotase [Chondrinema litorale]UZR95000.1 dihydroorotase [Chondrinema litorale]
MNILLQNIKLYAPTHSLHNRRVNLLVNNGKVTDITESDITSADTVINGSELSVSVGWTDMRAALNEPGFEYKEDIQTLCKAAANGGFTDVAVLPNTYPVVDSAQGVLYIKQKSAFTPVNLHPIAAMTKKTEGKELSEMIDLCEAGAKAFSDGLTHVHVDAVFGRALRYLQPLNSMLMLYPEESDLLEGGQMNEGVSSTMLGMKGIPTIAEEVAVSKALKMLEYYGGKIHFSTISTAASVALIREAKAKGLQVTCDVAAYQYAFTDEALFSFDTNLKVNPPFRIASDNEAILEGLADGTIDAFVSNHIPQDTESKHLEFDLADFGMISLETAFAAANTYHNGKLDTAKVVEKLSVTPRNLLNLDVKDITVGEDAVLTIFHDSIEWNFSINEIASISKNTPFTGKTLKGKALGVINKGTVQFSELLKEKYQN